MDTPAKRRQIKDQMPQTRLDIVHTGSCTLLPDRHEMLKRMPKNSRVAEIGVAFGEFSELILATCKPKQLYLVDSWASDRYRAGLRKIKESFADLIGAEKVIVMQGLSTEVLGGFTPSSLDWVYIDTNHTYQTTLKELELCNELVAPGGRIAGHDFCTGNVIDAVPYGVVEAVTMFCKASNWQFEYLTVESRGHFSFCLKRL